MVKILSALIFGLVLLSTACGPAKPKISVTNVWGRESIRSAANSAFYMDIGNAGRSDDHLIGVTADACRSTELHETTLDEQDVMKMRQVGEILIPGGQTVKLDVGGYHIMCLDRIEEFTSGDLIPITLNFEISGDKEISAEIRQ